MWGVLRFSIFYILLYYYIKTYKLSYNTYIKNQESLILTSNRTGHYGAKAISQAISKNVIKYKINILFITSI